MIRLTNSTTKLGVWEEFISFWTNKNWKYSVEIQIKYCVLKKTMVVWRKIFKVSKTETQHLFLSLT